MISYVEGAELGPAELQLTDSSNELVDLSADTVTVKIGQPGVAAVVTKTSGFSKPPGPFGASDPNLVISWAAGDLDALDPGTYRMQITARNGSSQDRIWQTSFNIKRAIT